MFVVLNQWGRVTHLCASNLTSIGSDNGLSPGRHQTIIWTKNGILLIRPLGIKFRKIIIEMHTFSLKKMHLKLSFGKWRPFCLGLSVLKWRLVCINVHTLVATQVTFLVLALDMFDCAKRVRSIGCCCKIEWYTEIKMQQFILVYVWMKWSLIPALASRHWLLHRVLIWTNADMLLIVIGWIQFSATSIQKKNISWNYIVCTSVTILLRP